eukprot:398876-Rhodomonas_salina.3
MQASCKGAKMRATNPLGGGGCTCKSVSFDSLLIPNSFAPPVQHFVTKLTFIQCALLDQEKRESQPVTEIMTFGLLSLHKFSAMYCIFNAATLESVAAPEATFNLAKWRILLFIARLPTCPILPPVTPPPPPPCLGKHHVTLHSVACHSC